MSSGSSTRGSGFFAGDWGDNLVHALHRAAAAATGFHFYSGRGELTEALPYSRLLEQARCLAGRLLSTGLKHGDRVGLLADTDGDFVRAGDRCIERDKMLVHRGAQPTAIGKGCGISGIAR